MLPCSHDDCSWRPIAPSEAAARQQFAKHVVEEHTTPVEADVPDGKVEVKLEEDGEWMTLTAAEAEQLHKEVHDE